MEFIFQRGGDELTLEIRDDISTAEYLVVSHQPDGTTKTDRFSDQAGAHAYIQFMGERLRGEQWSRAESHRRPRGTIHEVARPEAAPEEPSDDTPRESVDGRVLAMRVRPVEPPELATQEDEDEAPSSEAPEGPADWQGAAYVLESPLTCPYCREWIQSIKVLRLVRSQVAFTSTLPRSGRVLVCPGCDTILSAGLSGLF